MLFRSVNPLFRVLNPLQPYQDNETGRQQFGAAIGVALISDTSKVLQYLNIPLVRSNFPANAKFLWGKQMRDDNGNLSKALQLYVIKTIPGRETAEIEGNAIDNSFQDFDQLGNVTVSMSMTTTGGQKWAEMTGRNVNKPIAIVLDDVVYSAPNEIGRAHV